MVIRLGEGTLFRQCMFDGCVGIFRCGRYTNRGFEISGGGGGVTVRLLFINVFIRL